MNPKDPEVRAVATDYEIERGLYPPLGSLIHIVTATYAYRGVLEVVTPSHYVLAPGSALVFETGPHKDYYATRKGQTEEVSSLRRYVERGACVCLEVWP